MFLTRTYICRKLSLGNINQVGTILVSTCIVVSLFACKIQVIKRHKFEVKISRRKSRLTFPVFGIDFFMMRATFAMGKNLSCSLRGSPATGSPPSSPVSWSSAPSPE